MTRRNQQNVIMENGRTLILPAWKGGQEGWGNLHIPDIREVNSGQRYPVGTKMLDNERVFYYAQTASGGYGITRTNQAVKQKHHQVIGQVALTQSQVAGDKELKFLIGSNGTSANGNVAANELAGGFVLVFPGSYDDFVCRIVSNNETSGSGDTMTLALQDEIPVDLVTTIDDIECIANQFTGLETQATPADEETPVAGVSRVKVTAGYWFWLQTWGPVWLSPDGAVCNAAEDHAVVFGGDGALREVGSAEKRQVAGYGLAHAYGGGQGAPFVFLQITP